MRTTTVEKSFIVDDASKETTIVLPPTVRAGEVGAKITGYKTNQKLYRISNHKSSRRKQ